MLQGEVSILAHSLGSVLCYDTLCNQPHLFAALQEKQRQLKPAAIGNAESLAEPPPQPPPRASTELLPFSSTDLDPQRQPQVLHLKPKLLNLNPKFQHCTTQRP